ncbi:MAG: galactose-1-phosphate uridylyltransferase [Pseudomonadota bacterium]
MVRKLPPGVSSLTRMVGGQPVYRRDWQKSDGRSIYFYGYQPHDLSLVPGSQLEQLAGGELRYHPLRQTWSVYAAERNKRTFKPSVTADPLAPSQRNSDQTEIPFEDFELCVFENRFPAFHSQAADPTNGLAGVTRANAKGACEVVVYSPEKTGSLSTIGQARRRLLLSAWIDRYEELYSQGNAYVLPFENRGDEVGVTLHHPHGQIYALPFIPQPQERAQAAFDAGYDLASHLVDWQEDHGIAEAGGVVAFAPPFAQFPYEVWLASLNPVSGPWAYSEEQADGFAHLLGTITERYDAFFGKPTPYMFSLQASPHGRDGHFQFTAQFYPVLRAPDRIKYFASVEHVTGVYTVDVLPTDAAKSLKEAL